MVGPSVRADGRPRRGGGLGRRPAAPAGNQDEPTACRFGIGGETNRACRLSRTPCLSAGSCVIGFTDGRRHRSFRGRQLKPPSSFRCVSGRKVGLPGCTAGTLSTGMGVRAEVTDVPVERRDSGPERSIASDLGVPCSLSPTGPAPVRVRRTPTVERAWPASGRGRDSSGQGPSRLTVVLQYYGGSTGEHMSSNTTRENGAGGYRAVVDRYTDQPNYCTIFAVGDGQAEFRGDTSAWVRARDPHFVDVRAHR